LLTLTGGHAPALGIPTLDVDPGRAPFRCGSVLLAYTDGLVERRDQDLDTGIDHLGRELRTALIRRPSTGRLIAGSMDPDDAVLRRIVDAVTAGSHRRDDIAAVLIRRH
jgi:hypothetical protein